MLETKLIMLEGLPSTGKTTNSQFLKIQLERNGYKVKWIHEVAHPHPTILQDIPVNKFPLNNKYKKLTLDKWSDYSKKISDKDEIHILDSAIFQFHIFWFLLNNASIKNLKNFVFKILGIIKILNPCIIYFYRNNIEETINYLEKERGTNTLEKIWERDRSLPYYQDKPTGVEGFKQFLKDYAYFVNLLFDSYPYKKESVEISEGNWHSYENRMLSFLGIDNISFSGRIPEAGVYKNKKLNFEIVVDGMTIIDPLGGTRKIMSKSDNEFYVERLPVILKFENNNQIVISGFQIIERWTTIGLIYEKMDK
jgi:hypothetical protein